jgi:hypothetical protein
MMGSITKQSRSNGAKQSRRFRKKTIGMGSLKYVLPLASDQVRPATTNLASNSDIINRKEFTRKLNG